MDIFDHAIQLEKEGERLYRELSDKTEQAGLKNIFNWLADEEAKHLDIFQRMKNDQTVDFQSPEILKKARSIFEELRAKKIFSFDASQTAFYKKAQEVEKRSEDFYMKVSTEAGPGAQKEIFQKIAAEERKHYFLLEHIIELVTRPETWLENAEWYHLEEY